jgi:predicted nuclease with TOPRIM domain
MMNLVQRVERLEAFVETVKERLARIEARLDVIEATMATKADLAALETRLIKWFIGTAFTMSTITASIAFAAWRFIH